MSDATEWRSRIHGSRLRGALALLLAGLIGSFPACSNGNGSDSADTVATSQLSAQQYDASGRLTRVQYGDGRSVVYEYDAAGNVVSRRVTN